LPKLGPDATINTSLLLGFIFSNLYVFAYFKELQVLTNHFFSKYCLVINIVLEFSIINFIFFHKELFKSSKIFIVGFQFTKTLEHNSDSEKYCVIECSNLSVKEYVRSRHALLKALTRPFLGFVLNPKSK